MALYLKIDLNADSLVTVRASIADSRIGADFSSTPIAKGTTVASALRAAARKYAGFCTAALKEEKEAKDDQPLPR